MLWGRALLNSPRTRNARQRVRKSGGLLPVTEALYDDPALTENYRQFAANPDTAVLTDQLGLRYRLRNDNLQLDELLDLDVALDAAADEGVAAAHAAFDAAAGRQHQQRRGQQADLVGKIKVAGKSLLGIVNDNVARLKRMGMRSWRRGTKEMDLILGPWADAHLAGLSPERLEEYEVLLAENDQDLMAWIFGQAGPPAPGPAPRSRPEPC